MVVPKKHRFSSGFICCIKFSSGVTEGKNSFRSGSLQWLYRKTTGFLVAFWFFVVFAILYHIGVAC